LTDTIRFDLSDVFETVSRTLFDLASRTVSDILTDSSYSSRGTVSNVLTDTPWFAHLDHSDAMVANLRFAQREPFTYLDRQAENRQVGRFGIPRQTRSISACLDRFERQRRRYCSGRL